MRLQTRTLLLVTFTLAAMIAFLTLRPDNGGAAAMLPWGDKVNHAIAFAALVFPVAAFRPRWILPALLMIAAYGWLIEIVQPYMGRSRDIMDWIADISGAIFGCLAGLAAGQFAALRSNQAGRRLLAARPPRS